MIIPVIFTLLPLYENLIHTWIFYKGIDIAKRHGWPVFAQQQYFTEKEKQVKMGYMMPGIAETYDFDMIYPEDYDRIVGVQFPQELVDDYVNRFPSQTDAYLASMGQPWPEMTKFLADKVRQCEKKIGQEAEALLCLGAPRFVRDAAKELDVDIIHYEWGPLRIPSYRCTAYLDLKGNVCDGEMLERYASFLGIKDEVPIFRKKEILSLFLCDDQLDKLTESDVRPKYKAGLVLGYSVPAAYTVYSEMTAAEMQTKALQYFGNHEMSMRSHPGDPLQCKLRGPELVEGNLIDFIRNSERILCISSNIAYESMLWNRPSYDLGMTMYGQMGNHHLEGLPDRIASDDFLSFIAFGYLIPFELVKNVEYLRWRLSRPSEKEIYLYHLNYYCDCLHVGKEILGLPNDERLKALLKNRNQNLVWREELNEEDIWHSENEMTRMYATIERLKNEQTALRRALNEMESRSRQQESKLSEYAQRESRMQQALNKYVQKENCLSAALMQEEAQRHAAEEECKVLKGTISWRITEPLRKIKCALKGPKK